MLRSLTRNSATAIRCGGNRWLADASCRCTRVSIPPSSTKSQNGCRCTDVAIGDSNRRCYSSWSDACREASTVAKLAGRFQNDMRSEAQGTAHLEPQDSSARPSGLVHERPAVVGDTRKLSQWACDFPWLTRWNEPARHWFSTRTRVSRCERNRKGFSKGRKTANSI